MGTAERRAMLETHLNTVWSLYTIEFVEQIVQSDYVICSADVSG